MGPFFARMPRRTLRRAAADLFGPVEHFDGLSQACLAPSNTSTGCRRLVWPRRTLRRAAAGLFGPLEHFDELPQACLAPSNTSTGCRRLRTTEVCGGEGGLRIGFSALLLPPFIRCRPRRSLLHFGRKKGNPVKNRSSTRYCKSTFHPVSLSTQPLSEPFGREGAPRYTQDKPGNLPNEDLHNGASAALPSTSSGSGHVLQHTP